MTTILDEDQTNDHSTRVSPSHTFLTPKEVFARYRWGRTKGYEMLKEEGFPGDIAGSYRLDTLIAWEERMLAAALSAQKLAAQEQEAAKPQPQAAPVALPVARKGGRRKKVAH